MNITLSAEEAVTDALIRDHLKSLSAETDLSQVAQQFRRNALSGRSESDYRFGT